MLKAKNFAMDAGMTNSLLMVCLNCTLCLSTIFKNDLKQNLLEPSS